MCTKIDLLVQIASLALILLNQFFYETLFQVWSVGGLKFNSSKSDFAEHKSLKQKCLKIACISILKLPILSWSSGDISNDACECGFVGP